MNEDEFRCKLQKMNKLLAADVGEDWRWIPSKTTLEPDERRHFRAICLGLYGNADKYSYWKTYDLQELCWKTALAEVREDEYGKASISHVSRNFFHIISWPRLLWRVFATSFFLVVAFYLMSLINETEKSYSTLPLSATMGALAVVIAICWFMHVHSIKARTMNAIALSLMWDEQESFMESFEFFSYVCHEYLHKKWMPRRTSEAMKKYIQLHSWYRYSESLLAEDGRKE